MKKAIVLGTVLTAALLSHVMKPQIREFVQGVRSEKVVQTVPEKKEVKTKNEEKVYAEQAEKKFLLPENKTLTPYLMDDKEEIDTLIQMAEHDLKLIRWNYGYDDVHMFGVPKRDANGMNMKQDTRGFTKDRKRKELVQFKNDLMQRKYELDRESLAGLEQGYQKINLLDYNRILERDGMKSDGLVELARKLVDTKVNKIYLKDDGEKKIAVLHWDKNKSLVLKDIKVSLEAKTQLMAGKAYLEMNGKSENYFGALHISENQYRCMEELARDRNDIAAYGVFGMINSKLTIPFGAFISVNDIRGEGVKVIRAGKGQETVMADLPSEAMKVLKDYHAATRDVCN